MIKFSRDKIFFNSKLRQQRLINGYSPNPSLINRMTEDGIVELEKELENIDLGN